MSFSFDRIGDKLSGEVQTLVISYDLSKQATSQVKELILSWMRHGEVSIEQHQEGLLVVGLAPQAHPFKLRNRSQSQSSEPMPTQESVPV